MIKVNKIKKNKKELLIKKNINKNNLNKGKEVRKNRGLIKKNTKISNKKIKSLTKNLKISFNRNKRNNFKRNKGYWRKRRRFLEWRKKKWKSNKIIGAFKYFIENGRKYKKYDLRKLYKMKMIMYKYYKDKYYNKLSKKIFNIYIETCNKKRINMFFLLENKVIIIVKKLRFIPWADKIIEYIKNNIVRVNEKPVKVRYILEKNDCLQVPISFYKKLLKRTRSYWAKKKYFSQKKVPKYYGATHRAKAAILTTNLKDMKFADFFSRSRKRWIILRPKYLEQLYYNK